MTILSSVLKSKLWFDLWTNKRRTLQVVLIIAMGAAAIGMIISVRQIMIPAMESGWQAMNPAMINLAVSPGLTQNELIALSKEEGVVEWDAYNAATVEWRLSPDDDWASATLTYRRDYPNQPLNKLELTSGTWPSGETLATEQGALANFGIPENGGPVYLRINDREREIYVEGTLYNQLAPPAVFGGTPQFYATEERYRDLTGSETYNTVILTASEYDEAQVTALADALQDKLLKQGKDSFGTNVGRVTDPSEHFFQDSLDGLFFLLGVMGLLALILGLLLVYNTINAVISQQLTQIGIMKAIGANTRQLLGYYLLNILAYSFLSLLVALPLGMGVGWLISAWLIGAFNADPGSFVASGLALGVMVVICLVAPLVASLIPLWRGTRITVREAMGSYGLGSDSGLLERFLANTKRISRLALLTISNTFRRKWRVLLMQVALVMSGLIFMMVVSVRDSVVYTFDEVLFSILNYDINFVLSEAERIEPVETMTRNHPDVTAVEMWGLASGSLRLQGQPESEDDESSLMFGVELPTTLYGYQLRAGRWLEPDDTYAVVLNQELADEAGLDVGDWITFQYGPRQSTDWQIVGLVFDPILTNSAHVPRATLLRETGNVGRAQTVWIQTRFDNVEDHAALATELRTDYAEQQFDVSPQRGVFGVSDTATETGQSIINQFSFIVGLLGIMAVIIGAVGSIALSGTLSLSVLERRREIGVMRAIGASSWDILRLFVGEGLLLGWLSWLIALPFSYFAGQVMLNGIGAAFQLDLVYKYTPLGTIMWLVIITILSVLASILPARGAIRVSVRESLAYQ